MSLRKNSGIVLNSILAQETDIILTILGKNQPKSKYRVKGIKKSKKRPIVATEIASFITIDFYQHQKNEIFNVKDISIHQRFSNIKSSYSGFLFLNYICELINILLPDGEEYYQCFDLVLAMLETVNKLSYKPLVLPFFKLKFLSINGLISENFHCHECGKDIITKNTGVYLDPSTLELTCFNCQSNSPNMIDIILLMKKILTTNYKKSLEEKIPIQNIIQLDKILNEYIYSYINKEIKTHKIFYNSLDVNYEFSY